MAGNPLGPFVAKMADTAAANLFHPPSPVIISASVIKQTNKKKKRKNPDHSIFTTRPKRWRWKLAKKRGRAQKVSCSRPRNKVISGRFIRIHNVPVVTEPTTDDIAILVNSGALLAFLLRQPNLNCAPFRAATRKKKKPQEKTNSIPAEFFVFPSSSGAWGRNELSDEMYGAGDDYCYDYCAENNCTRPLVHAGR